MLKAWKYILILVLAVPAIYAYAPPSFKEMAKPRWFADNISTSLAANPHAEVPAVDPIVAAKVDEDLDYRIAERTRSAEGWQAFLTAHPNGPHAQSAHAELDKLMPPPTPSAPTAVEAPETGGADTNMPRGSDPPPLPSTGSDAATLASDEICRGDEDRLQRLSDSPTSDGVIRLLIELRCEKLRPQLLSLAKRLDDKVAAPADAAQDASSGLPVEVAPKAAPAQAAKARTTEPQHRARPGVASRAAEPKRRVNHEKAASLPAFLLALFGVHPTSRQTRSAGGGGH